VSLLIKDFRKTNLKSNVQMQGAFRVNKRISKQLKQRKRRIQYRLREIHWKQQSKPMFSGTNIHYEIADRSRGLACGGIRCMQLLARQTGLLKAIDDRLKLLKRHLPYIAAAIAPAVKERPNILIGRWTYVMPPVSQIYSSVVTPTLARANTWTVGTTEGQDLSLVLTRCRT
jgi:hypothetical protein